MALLFALILLGLVLIDDDLTALHLSQDLAFDLRALHDGRADLSLVTVADEQHLIKSNRFIRLRVELLYEDNVALLNTVLLATGLNDCVHALHLLFKNLAETWHHARSMDLKPVSSGLPLT